MTKAEIIEEIKEARDDGRHLVMILPELPHEVPSINLVESGLWACGKETGIIEVKQCYATVISKLTEDEYIERFVETVFEVAKLTSAWGISCC